MTKCRGLTAEGITAHNWCGSYSLPAATITGSVRREVSHLKPAFPLADGSENKSLPSGMRGSAC